MWGSKDICPTDIDFLQSDSSQGLWEVIELTLGRFELLIM